MLLGYCVSPLVPIGLYFGNISINHFVIYTCSGILDTTDLKVRGHFINKHVDPRYTHAHNVNTHRHKGVTT